MPDPTSAVLYHISGVPGLTVFQPRRCWFNATRTCSGMLAEGAEPPEGCAVRYGVFAGDERYARFFCIPSHLKRLSIRRTGAAFAPFIAELGIAGELPKEVLLLQAADREAIAAERRHIYEFDPADFVRFPSGEFFSERPVVPLSERALLDPLEELRAHGICPIFVDDLEALFVACLARGVPFGIVANIEAARQLLGNDSRSSSR